MATSKITFRPERNFSAKRPRQIAAMNALVEAEMSRPLAEQEWFCNACGFVPVPEIRREREDSTEGVCKCGRVVYEIPF